VARPVQAVAIPVTPAFAEYGERVVKELKKRGVRAELDKGDERMNAKIRNAQNQKVPFMIILGEKEQAGGTVPCARAAESRKTSFPMADFLSMIEEEVRPKTLDDR